MAEIVKVTHGSHNWHEINVSASVGKGGINNSSDVLAIQVLLKSAFESIHRFRSENVPIPTGIMDANTIRLIKRYQRHMQRTGNSRAVIDGRIDPSRGGSPLVPGKTVMWTISSLNANARESHLLSNRLEANYMIALCVRFPRLKLVLGEIPVGELGLTLESSNSGVGSLGLSLESSSPAVGTLGLGLE